MITPQELQALVSILNRTPMTPAEQLWIQGLLDRLATPIPTPETEAKE